MKFAERRRCHLTGTDVTSAARPSACSGQSASPARWPDAPFLIQSRERNRMNATTVQIDQKEEEILSFEVSELVWKAPQRPRWPSHSSYAPAAWFARFVARSTADEAEAVVLDLERPLRAGWHDPAHGR